MPTIPSHRSVNTNEEDCATDDYSDAFSGDCGVLETGDSRLQLAINGFAEEMLVYCRLEEGMSNGHFTQGGKSAQSSKMGHLQTVV